GRDEAALEAFDQALILAPTNVWAWVNKGDVLRRLGRYPKAETAYEQALQLDPNDPHAAERRRSVAALLLRTIPDQRIRLRDGRWLGYIDCGDPGGVPVICCHGKPGSRLDFIFNDYLCRELGLRLIAPDRPGFGLSDFRPNGSFLGWADDV